ncbi:hypothetical protein [Natronococcus sp. A-GB7]|uniref:OsmC family protein n=1 Tax=Natronococcus sp. A-GB7 TaxID=3037649 RepID=UPI00241CBA3F|nr:hypothetical protein [Natronococcus sp. A-GB7]MDG5818202.1 hypothetical protein [Natronococcus sp. A-GB7]
MTSIDEFDQAGERVRTQELHVEGDEPEQILGERTAPNAVELLLAALGSCLNVGYAANAAAMGVMSESLDTEKPEREIKSMYRDIAESAAAEFHFETGRELADRLGYDPDTLTYVPDGVELSDVHSILAEDW